MSTNGMVTSCRGGGCGGAPEHSRWTAIIGGLLVLAGLALLGDRAGVIDVGVVWDYWPLIPIAVGAAGLVLGPRGERSLGFWLLVSGIYCAVAVWHLCGFSWATAWPIFLVAGGLQMLSELVFERPERSTQSEGYHVD